ncbi:MAG: TetR family transcriptional regulator C-terminal domain-containing protein [Coriobacteriales bacterium]|jgi:AcrR family transcriptional regulator|nr:TetR family transcriptional regulator C-terminal domain-containing protein [Coriobacteriales bacterium]
MPDQTLSARPLCRSEKAFTDAFIGMLKEMDFDKIRTSEIIRRSGFSRGGFYAQFLDKYDLADKIVEREVQFYVQNAIRCVRAVETGCDDAQLLSILADFMERVYQKRDLYDIILDSRFPGVTLDDFCRRIRDSLDKKVITVVPGMDDNLDFAYHDYADFYGSLVHLKFWRLNGYRISPEDMAKKELASIRKQPYRYRFAEGS